MRIVGSEEQIAAAIARLKTVFTIGNMSRLYPSREESDTYCRYLRCYVYSDSDSDSHDLYSQLQAALADVANLQIRNGELELQLGLLPKPAPGDVVLSPRHRPNSK